MEFYSGCGYTDHAFLINDVIVQVITTIQIGISHCKEGRKDQLKYSPPIKRRTTTAAKKQRLGYIRARAGFHFHF